jgi:PTS system nitrogen regulatory IIA component
MMNKTTDDTLAQLIARGGVYYDVPGGDRKEVMANVITGLEKQLVLRPSKNTALLQAVMEREALISTGMENGIALPHPRTPMLEEAEDPFVVIAFPSRPIDWNTPDGSKVHTVFLIVSKSPKQHLEVMSKINVLCQDKNFYGLLSSKAQKEKIIAAIEEAEKDWGS